MNEPGDACEVVCNSCLTLPSQHAMVGQGCNIWDGLAFPGQDKRETHASTRTASHVGADPHTTGRTCKEGKNRREIGENATSLLVGRRSPFGIEDPATRNALFTAARRSSRMDGRPPSSPAVRGPYLHLAVGLRTWNAARHPAPAKSPWLASSSQQQWSALATSSDGFKRGNNNWPPPGIAGDKLRFDIVNPPSGI